MKTTIKFGGFEYNTQYEFAIGNDDLQMDIGKKIVHFFNFQFKTNLEFINLLSNEKVIFKEDELIVKVSKEDEKILRDLINDREFKFLKNRYNEKLSLIERDIDEYDELSALVNTLYEWVRDDIFNDLIGLF